MFSNVSLPILATQSPILEYIANIPQVVIIIIAVLVLALLVISSKYIVHFIRQLIRFISRNVSKVTRLSAKILRRLHLLPKTSANNKAIEISALAGASNLTDALCETDQELEKYSEEYSKYLSTDKIFFQMIDIKRIPHETSEKSDEELKEEQSFMDYDNAKEFFHLDVPIESNPLNFYDDIYNAFLVKSFGNSDAFCFLVLSEFNKVVARNFVKFTVLGSVIISFFILANIMYSDSISFYTMFGLSQYNTQIESYLPVLNTTFLADILAVQLFFNKFIFAIFSYILAFLLIKGIHFAYYLPVQNNNKKELNQYLTVYLQGIRQSFTSIKADAIGVLNKDTKGAEARVYQTEKVVRLVTNLRWMNFRVYFIKQFMRTTLFQIRRKSVLTKYILPTSFILLTLLIGFYKVSEYNVLDINSNWYSQNIYYLCFFLIFYQFYKMIQHTLDIQKNMFAKVEEDLNLSKIDSYKAISNIFTNFMELLFAYKDMRKGG